MRSLENLNEKIRIYIIAYSTNAQIRVKSMHENLTTQS